MSFTSANEKVPVKEGKYMNWKIGENRFRVLDGKISGWEGWKTQGDGKKKPVRCKEEDALSVDDIDDPDETKHFWCFPVWNYAANRVQLLKVTQSGIKNAIIALGKNPKWGEPMAYDIVVTAVGDGFEREYSTQPDPKEPLDDKAQAEWEKVKAKLDMNAYFKNGDPFGEEQTSRPAKLMKKGLNNDVQYTDLEEQF